MWDLATRAQHSCTRLGGPVAKFAAVRRDVLQAEGADHSDFKGRHFEGEIVLWAVRWYCRYGVSYRDLEQMMGERGVSVDHSTHTAAAKRFLGKALNGLKDWEKPTVINTDKAPTYAAALAELKKEGKCPKDTVHRQVKYLNNLIEANHGKLKQLIRPVRGFKTLKAAYATIKGFEVMRALRKGQASAFNLTRDIRGEARIVERAFGLGASALAEAVHFLDERLQLEAA